MVDPVLSSLALTLLTVIFATAALAKLRSLDLFTRVVEQYDLLPRILLRPIGYGLPVVELVAALGLLVPAMREPAAVVLILLLLIFAAAMAINLARGRSDLDCGCFIGVQRQQISWTLVARNLVLAGFSLMLLAEGTGRPLAALDWFTIVVAAGSLLLLFEAIGRLFGLAPRVARRAG